MSETIHVPVSGEAIKSDFGVAFGTGPTVPADGLLGWQHGAIWTKALGTTSIDALYINTGSPASCAFRAVGDIAALSTGTLLFPISMDNWKVHDALLTPLGLTALSADDLIFTPGSYGTTSPLLKGSDVGGTSVTQYGRKLVPVSERYVPGGAMSLVVTAYMQHVSDDSDNTVVAADVYRTAAPSVAVYSAIIGTTINSVTPAAHTAVFTPTNIVPGDVLDIRIYTAVNDAGDAAPNINSIISEVHLAALCYL